MISKIFEPERNGVRNLRFYIKEELRDSCRLASIVRVVDSTRLR
jgi:hypothetical protein